MGIGGEKSLWKPRWGLNLPEGMRRKNNNKEWQDSPVDKGKGSEVRLLGSKF